MNNDLAFCDTQKKSHFNFSIVQFQCLRFKLHSFECQQSSSSIIGTFLYCLLLLQTSSELKWDFLFSTIVRIHHHQQQQQNHMMCSLERFQHFQLIEYIFVSVAFIVICNENVFITIIFRWHINLHKKRQTESSNAIHSLHTMWSVWQLATAKCTLAIFISNFVLRKNLQFEFMLFPFRISGRRFFVVSNMQRNNKRR